MCGRLSTLEVAIKYTGTCTALAGMYWMGANVRKREANYRRRKTIEAIQIKKGEIVILARIHQSEFNQNDHHPFQHSDSPRMKTGMLSEVTVKLCTKTATTSQV